MTDNSLRNREIIFEIRPVGNAARVSAMDTQTMTEVSIQCPTNTPEALMKSSALRRIEYVMRKKGIIQ